MKAEAINQETANRIQEYYKSKNSSSTNRVFIIFGILGAVLIGAGIILIMAHNWDKLPRIGKTFFAFLPLVVGQFLCGYTLMKKHDSTAWRENTTAFLFFAIGLSIYLVSQIYHISGDFGAFLLAWLLLCLPLVYIMKSSVVSLLYLIGITWYAFEVRLLYDAPSGFHLYWLLIVGVLPYYYLLSKKKPESNFMIFHNWIIPLSVIIALPFIFYRMDELLTVAYSSLFGLFYLIGNKTFFTQQSPRNNGYKILGSLGTIVLLMSLSFDWFWKDLRKKELQFMISAPEFYISVILSLLAIGVLYLDQKNKPLNNIKPLAFIFVLFIMTFILGMFSPIAVVLINIYVFIIGIITIRDGAKQNHLGTLNYGLLIISGLIVFRFFDTDLSFVIRGILFVLFGAGFFVMNYWSLKKRRVNEQ